LLGVFGDESLDEIMDKDWDRYIAIQASGWGQWRALNQYTQRQVLSEILQAE
jgi:hypothetical protein